MKKNRQNLHSLWFLLIVLVLGCTQAPKLESEGMTKMVSIDSLRYYYSSCFSFCPDDTVTFFKNGNVTIRGDKQLHRGNIIYRQLKMIPFLLNFINESGMYDWKCQYCFSCDGNTLHYDFFVQDSVYSVIIGNCSKLPLEYAGIHSLFEYLLENVDWEDTPPPLRYEFPFSAKARIIELEQQVKIGERKLRFLNSYLDKETTTGISVDTSDQKALEEEVKKLERELERQE